MDVGIVTAGHEGLMTWTYRGKLIRAYPEGPTFSGTTIGKRLSPEHQEIIDRIRRYQLEQLIERRKHKR